MLITVDVGDTLGSFDRPGTPEVLREVALAPDHAAEVDRNILHVVPELTADIAELVRERLLISASDWPQRIRPTGGFTAFPGTLAALQKLAALAPVVTLSNASCIAGPRRMSDLVDQCGQYLAEICTSYQLRAKKPQRRCWTTIAAKHQVPVGAIVHLGDRVDDDIVGALVVGCRAALLVNTRDVDVPDEVQNHPRVTVVSDLASAAERLAELAGEP
ncbi:HAD family hydrolase [Amycolatopsis sp. CA-230715]|uniref:HAD family hydrolase n=1 Tax=Amycolatopsis sp. CA-230715 TaxID=2745196 RepID=UPI001C01EA61|nr:HAD hydrolase-like protein [Amycolatopsis sp. CA-230715]QWF85895.1 hypothetical protein HUW46_09375 [Amycolatopsis sp. CA-230715]